MPNDTVQNNRSTIFTRRETLAIMSGGLGLTGLANAFDDNASNNTRQHAPKAKRIVWLFMGGGVSHVDSYDPKPSLAKYDRQQIPIDLPRNLRDANKQLLASPFTFTSHGESGLPVSELFPETAKHIDDICVIRSMQCNSIDHTGATLQTFTGMVSLPRPGLGCWLLYGLGTENRNLPGYIVIGPDQQSGSGTYNSRFLPSRTQGTSVPWRFDQLTGPDPALPNLINSAGLSLPEQQQQIDLISSLNNKHAQQRRLNNALYARTQGFRLAFNMQTAAPEAFDISAENQATHVLYGLDQPHTKGFGARCLLARRLLERGVRFVQVQCGKGDGLDWDQHGNLERDHRKNAMATDKPVAALLADLKRRGLLDDTLVIWGGEFGRTPTSQGTNGREHHPHGYTLWMAGGGVRGGMAYGATDEFGWYSVENRVHIHDLHATILYLMGIDHEKQTFRYSGRDFRLTDVHGKVVTDIIA